MIRRCAQQPPALPWGPRFTYCDSDSCLVNRGGALFLPRATSALALSTYSPFRSAREALLSCLGTCFGVRGPPVLPCEQGT